jgi:osmoprotectant transport system ATP-binding protein
MSVALAAEGISHSYGDVTALSDVSLDVAAGSAVAIVGESGSGKTTLLQCFNRLVEPLSGDVTVDGSSVRLQDPIALRRRIGYVQQHGGLIPHWTVMQNVGLVLRASHRRDERAVAEALALAGLDQSRFGARFPRELSGGQRQRVALARALAASPEAILLDEPFGGLDAITRAEVQDAFAGVQRETSVTILLVTHDLAEAARLATEIVVMRNGSVEQRGTIVALQRAPATEYVRALVSAAVAQLEALRPE